MTMRVSARDLEPLQGGQRGRQGSSAGRRQQSGQQRKQRKEPGQQQRRKEQQQQAEAGGGGVTIQTAANTIDVRGQRAVEVPGWLLLCRLSVCSPIVQSDHATDAAAPRRCDVRTRDPPT